MFCPTCGARVADGASFCPRCGSRIAGRPDAPLASGGATTLEPGERRPRRRRALAIGVAIAAVAVVAVGIAVWLLVLAPRGRWVVSHAENVWTASPDELGSDDTALFTTLDLVNGIQVANLAPSAVPPLHPPGGAAVDYELSDRGAVTRVTTSYADGDPTVTDYALDDHGNTVSPTLPGDEAGYQISYDDQGRLKSASTSEGTTQTVTYASDGSYQITFTYEGGTREAWSYDGGGRAVSCDTFDSDGMRTGHTDYEDGFATYLVTYNPDGSVEREITGALGRDGQGRVVTLDLWDSAPAALPFTRLIFEYDEHGNICHVCAPWASEEVRNEYASRSGSGLVANDAYALELRFGYQWVEDPTPLVSLLGTSLTF